MLKASLLICRKDLILCFCRGNGLLQAVILGLLLIFVFSLSLLPGQRMTPQGAASIFWLASAFCHVLIFSTVYAYEEGNGQRQGLILGPAPVQCVWLGKAMAGLCVLFAAQGLFLPASVVFLSQTISDFWPLGLGIVLLADIGIVTVGSLLGALSQGTSSRESLLSIIVFPLLIPLFLSGIRIVSVMFSGIPAEGVVSWFAMTLAFNAIFIAAALFLFPVIYNAEE
ncbi:MAG: heme exporter protein CcmB [Desulfovibrio sp.]|nr:heme exporter protein CcmB [Desulfovibrio sp.]